jgi:putative nucleotidyltransferase with HDIG domain
VSLIGVASVGVLAVGVVGTVQLRSGTLVDNLFPAALLIAVSWYGSQRRVLVSESDIWLMGTVGYIATLVLLPFPLAVLSIAASKGLAEATLLAKKQRHSWKGVTVNAGGTIVAAGVGGAVFETLRGSSYLWSHHLDSVLALPVLLAMILVYNVANELVVVGAITLTSQENPWSVFWRLSRAALIPEISLALVGIVFAVLYHSSPIMAAFIVVPVMFSLRAFESVATLRRETVEAVLRMAEHLDFRDTNTYEHSQRLADLTRRLASALELTPEHVEEIVLASRVHDLGKIGISNEILLKQGPLTEDEGDIMRKHPSIGAEILDSYSMFKSSVQIVRHHHERWDGKGYPDGLSGEHIPLGARIIAVADSFDAMTADRPYRKGLTVDDAVERLKAGMGTQYDPKLCAIFIGILMDEGIYTPSDTLPGELHLIPGGRPSGRASGGRAS